MKDFNETEVLEEIRKFALFNAVQHGKPPQAGAVMGRIMGMCPQLRGHAKEISRLVSEVVRELSRGDAASWRRELEVLAPELIEELGRRREPVKGLPPLEHHERVVMRFAPNPNGPPTLGSARGIIVNSEYAKRYNGRFILRFDDTDPKTKRPLLDAYDWYLEDCRWLGAEPDEVVIASDYMDTYYEYAQELIERGGAYVCFCGQEEFKRYKDAATPCPHRRQSREEALEHWKDMLEGVHAPGSAVLRVRTDIRYRDPAIRDWAAFRIIDTPHPRPEIHDRYHVWPLLDFESALQDHLLGITHIIRGKDLIDSERRQEYLYRYFGWEYPLTLHWGRVKIHEFGRLSTSAMSDAIKRGEYAGWDDPHLPTIRALRRRGIQPEALRTFFINLGVGETDVSLSMENLYAENRKIVDRSAKRYFFVSKPVRLLITGAEPTTAHPLLHPSHEEWGCRCIQVGDTVLLSHSDVEVVSVGEILRLKDLYNIRVIERQPGLIRAEYIGGGIEVVRRQGGRILHWAPVDGVGVRVLMPDGGVDEGIGERGILEAPGEVVQFERYGFVRIDRVEEVVLACFTHK